MKRLFMGLILVLGMSIRLPACDVCGCGGGGSGIGLFLAWPSNAFLITGSVQRFHSDAADGTGWTDGFSSLTVQFRHRVFGKWYAQVAQPVHWNWRLHPEGNHRVSGLGDTRLTAQRILLSEASPSQTRLVELGGGVILPTGAYDAHIHDREVPENFNPGKGSWGLLLQPRAYLARARFGWVAQGEYVLRAGTSSGYRFGQEATLHLLCTLEQTGRRLAWLKPWLGVQGQWLESDHYATGNDVPGTGGTALFGSAGAQASSGRFLAGVAGQVPIIQSFSSGEVSAGWHWTASLGWFF